MEGLSITLAILLVAWVYAAMHEINGEQRSELGYKLVVGSITWMLTVSSLVIGITAAAD